MRRTNNKLGRKPTGRKVAAKDHTTKGRGNTGSGYYSGPELFDWLEERFDIEIARPLVVELCTIADRLAQVRRALEQGLDGRLLSSEVKLLAQYSRVWKLLGLAEKEPGRPGRPPGVPGTRVGKGVV
jgi:hypothetical protein